MGIIVQLSPNYGWKKKPAREMESSEDLVATALLNVILEWTAIPEALKQTAKTR